MIVYRLVYWTMIIITITSASISYDEEHRHSHIPFCMNVRMRTTKRSWSLCLVVMQPHTIIKQTLHSYCKEQIQFNAQTTFINLTEYRQYRLPVSPPLTMVTFF